MSIRNDLQEKICYLTVFFLLGACSGHNQIVSDIEAYSDRLQSFTEISLSEPTKSIQSQAAQLAVPKKSELRIDIPQVSINLREFYAFNDCSLNQLVAQRNTTLGKMQLPSSRYAYEMSLISELATCKQNLLAGGEDNNELVSKLQMWSDTKHQHLPAAYSNLLTQSDEVYAHLFRATDYLSGSGEDNLVSVKQAFMFLLNAKTIAPLDLASLEYHLQQLDMNPLMARKWKTQKYLTEQLDHISILLTEFNENKTCQTSEEEEQIKIMRNIFTKFFAETIQPLASELNKYHYQLSPMLEQIMSSPDIPTLFVDYIAYHEQTSYQSYTKSMRNHISIWQDIFAKCS